MSRKEAELQAKIKDRLMQSYVVAREDYERGAPTSIEEALFRSSEVYKHLLTTFSYIPLEFLSNEYDRLLVDIINYLRSERSSYCRTRSRSSGCTSCALSTPGDSEGCLQNALVSAFQQRTNGTRNSTAQLYMRIRAVSSALETARSAFYELAVQAPPKVVEKELPPVGASVILEQDVIAPFYGTDHATIPETLGPAVLDAVLLEENPLAALYSGRHIPRPAITNIEDALAQTYNMLRLYQQVCLVAIERSTADTGGNGIVRDSLPVCNFQRVQIVTEEGASFCNTCPLATVTVDPDNNMAFRCMDLLFICLTQPADYLIRFRMLSELVRYIAQNHLVKET